MRDQMSFKTYLVRKRKELERSGRRQTSLNYLKLDKSLTRYLDSRYDRLSLDGITEGLVMSYESYLKTLGITLATVSFYNRIFRSIYNQAVKEGLVKNAHPFDSAYTKVIPPKRVQMVDVNGEMVDMSTLTKDEVIARYCILADKHNRLIKSITEMVHVS